MAEPNSGPRERSVIAIVVIGVSTGALVALAIALICTDSKDGGKTAFTMLVPMIATWVGTVLAYYFSGENFQKASDSMNRMMGQVIDDKLKTIPVKNAWTDRGNMSVVKLPPNSDGSTVLLTPDFLNRFNNTVTRMPVLDENDVARYIIHQSEIFEFITKKATTQTAAAPVDVAKLTLKEFLDFENNAAFVSSTMAFVAVDQNLADAKARMEAIPNCQDVFVTDNGDKAKPVRGWLTNVEIAKRSKL